ncbi:MAG: cell wall hydrolase [Pseudomonadaceae bacterium]|nr:cell wall hydrolase [Pseudomonadaceae bacterium]
MPTSIKMVTVLLIAAASLSACANDSSRTSAASLRQADIDCLALAMYFEARGEGAKGMQAVGSVVLNRVAHDGFPGTVCKVIREGGEKPPCQFSWWCDGKSDKPRNLALWERTRTVARELLSGKRSDNTRGAIFFHNTSIDPNWPYKRTVTIGSHVFYR